MALVVLRILFLISCLNQPTRDTNFYFRSYSFLIPFIRSHHLILVLLVYTREINSIVDYNGLKLGKRSIDDILHHRVCGETNLITTFNNNSFTCIYIHTLSGTYRCHLECAESLYLSKFLVPQSIIDDIKHLADKYFSLCLFQPMLACKHGSKFVDAYLTHLGFLHCFSVFP